MTSFGYFLSTEEYGPAALIEQAAMAQECGFDALWISDTSTRGTAPKGKAPSSGR